MNSKEQIASYLLQIKAVELSPEKPFTWASGILSPIYCDNRKTLSYPQIRTFIRDKFVELINDKFNNVEAIAGVATGGIPQGAIVAQEMNLPFIYVRATSKKHGQENLIEGVVTKNQRVVVIEDLISTGGSSIAAIQALRQQQTEVLGLCAIFSYGFDAAATNFSQAECPFFTLSDFDILIKIAQQTNYITSDDLEKLLKWRKTI